MKLHKQTLKDFPWKEMRCSHAGRYEVICKEHLKEWAVSIIKKYENVYENKIKIVNGDIMCGDWWGSDINIVSFLVNRFNITQEDLNEIT